MTTSLTTYARQAAARRQASALARQLALIVTSQLPCYRIFEGFALDCMESETATKLCPVCTAVVKRRESDGGTQ